MRGKTLQHGGRFGQTIAVDELCALAKARPEQLEVGTARRFTAEHDEPHARQILPAGDMTAEQIAIHGGRRVQDGQTGIGDAVEQRLAIEAPDIERIDGRTAQQRTEDVLHGGVIAVGRYQTEAVGRTQTEIGSPAAHIVQHLALGLRHALSAYRWCPRCTADRPDHPDCRLAA